MKIQIDVGREDVYVGVSRTFEVSAEEMDLRRAMEGLGTAVAHMILKSSSTDDEYVQVCRFGDAIGAISHQAGQVIADPEPNREAEGPDLDVVDVSDE